jgi:AraC-like DNA-binding protein
MPKSTGLQHHLEEMILNQISAADLCEVKLASQLDMSLRSLQRHLKEYGTSYRKILFKVKREVACNRLSGSTETVQAIGKSLGFTDSSNFSRAFRRWEGCSPSHYRRKKMLKRKKELIP